MIENILRERLKPIADRQKKLQLRQKLALWWLTMALGATCLLLLYAFKGWSSPIAMVCLCLGLLVTTVVVFFRLHRHQLDYKAIARDIERHHPDLKALLLAAIEQKPQEPQGHIGYLQERVIKEALAHAGRHDWSQTVSKRKLNLAGLGQFAALALFILAFSQLLPVTSMLQRFNLMAPAKRDYQITVTPGDVFLETASPIVVLATFNDLVPPDATLVVLPSQGLSYRVPLVRTLEDPIFGTSIPEVKTDLVYRIEYANRTTRNYTIKIYTHPELISADARIISPAYTDMPDKTIKDVRRVSAVQGSTLTLTFHLNKPVESSQLVGSDNSVIELNVDQNNPNEYTALFQLDQSLRYELRLTDAQGRSNKVPPRFIIDVHKNLPPELKLVFPRPQIQVSPLEEVEMDVEISDDFNLAGYGFSYTKAGGETNEIRLKGPIQKKQQRFQHMLAFEDLKVQPNQLVSYYFWAEDLGPDGQIRRTPSEIYFTEVRPFEQIYREMEGASGESGQGQQQNNNQLIKLQKQIINATWNLMRHTDPPHKLTEYKNFTQDLDVIHQAQTEVVKQTQSARTQATDRSAVSTLETAEKYMEDTLDHLQDAIDHNKAKPLIPALSTEQSAYQQLLKLRSNEHQVTRGQSSRSGGASSSQSQMQLQQMELLQKENRYETQRQARSAQTAAQQENLDVLKRLAELARRQSDMSKKIKELQSALQEAKTPQEKEQLQRELKRLRDEQQQLLRDLDELQQQTDRPDNRRRMSDVNEQLSQTRSKLQQTSENLSKGQVSKAAASSTRAQRELEQMRDDLRRKTSNQFAQQMRDMRREAQQLVKKENEIAQKINQQTDLVPKTLSASDENKKLAQSMDQQQTDLTELLKEMHQVTEQSEISEPLLSKKLYDSLREAKTTNIEQTLKLTADMLRHNMLPQAQSIEPRVRAGLEKLNQQINQAAKSVLGDEAQRLRAARRQLDELIEQLNQAAPKTDQSNAQSQNSPQQGQSSQQSQPSSKNQDQQASDQQGQSQQPPPGQGQSQQTSASSQSGSSSSGRSDQPAQANQLSPGIGQTGNQQSGGSGPRGGPLTNQDYRDWSSRLGDIQEMLDQPEQRNEIARIRDAARGLRVEFKRHGKIPHWNLVQRKITNPLTELRNRISDELALLQKDDAVVPIDRDPVPSRFSNVVRVYYESLSDK